MNVGSFYRSCSKSHEELFSKNIKGNENISALPFQAATKTCSVHCVPNNEPSTLMSNLQL